RFRDRRRPRPPPCVGHPAAPAGRLHVADPGWNGGERRFCAIRPAHGRPLRRRRRADAGRVRTVAASRGRILDSAGPGERGRCHGVRSVRVGRALGRSIPARDRPAAPAAVPAGTAKAEADADRGTQQAGLRKGTGTVVMRLAEILAGTPWTAVAEVLSRTYPEDREMTWDGYNEQTIRRKQGRLHPRER